MANLENLTPFAATAIPSMAVDGTEVLIVAVAGAFVLPGGGRPAPGPLAISDEQPPVPMTDVYWGEPDASSLRFEGQAGPHKTATDVWVEGHAMAPGGKAATRIDVALVIPGRVSKTVAVFGERVWTQGIGGLSATSPKPFPSMPLVHERAFGGAEQGTSPERAFEARNPVGRGFHTRESHAIGKPLPNLEDAHHLIRSVRDRPQPMAFGPVARSWQPRLGWAGTYDQKWLDQLAPAWPPDLDPRFFQAVPPDQQVHPKLIGGEPVGLSGVAADGPIHFVVPQYRLQVKSVFAKRAAWRMLELDTLVIEPDRSALTVVWRAVVPLPDGPLSHSYSVVRPLFDWEDSPA